VVFTVYGSFRGMGLSVKESFFYESAEEGLGGRRWGSVGCGVVEEAEE